MKKGSRLLGAALMVATIALIAIGTAWPNQSGASAVDSQARMVMSEDSPDAAVSNLLLQIGRRDWESAYASLANKSEFTEPEFIRDVNGSNGGLRTFADVDGFDIQPLHASSDHATIRASLRWASVLGSFTDSRDLNVMRTGDRWQVAWPIAQEVRVPPQVIPVNY